MTTKITLEQLQSVLDTYDQGVLSYGPHKPQDGAYCALEAVSLVRNNGWRDFTDSPCALGVPDVRPLNDACWSSDQARTDALLPLLVALSDWSEWTPQRQCRWAILVSVWTINQLITELEYLPNALRIQCRQAQGLIEATQAAQAAWAAAWAAAAATWAATAAARAAAQAAQAARAAAQAAQAATVEAARAAARTAAVEAAWAAAEVATVAAKADSTLKCAIAIWIQAAQDTEGL